MCLPSDNRVVSGQEYQYSVSFPDLNPQKGYVVTSHIGMTRSANYTSLKVSVFPMVYVTSFKFVFMIGKDSGSSV